MSQNKTVIQGLESNDTRIPNQGGAPQGGEFYQRGPNPKKGTIVSGIVETPQPVPQGGGMNEAKAAPKGASFSSTKPIVGFLYSVSRVASGEYWPLHIGQNTIGKNAQCDIVLPEGTISEEHAVLMVRKNKNPEKVIASITDARSTNGTMKNGVSLEFEPVACANGDILTFGDNYELLLLLVDAPTLGLKVSPNFIHVDVEEDDYQDEFDPFASDPHGTKSGFDPYSSMAGPQNFGGTVGYDGNQTAYNSGGTVGM